MDYVDQYRNELIRTGKSKNTVDSYIRDVLGFMSWFKDSYDNDFNGLILEQDVLQYKAFIYNVKKRKVSTVARKIDAIKSFNRFLVEVGVSKDIKVKPIRVVGNKNNVKVLEKNEFNKLKRAFYVKDNKRDISIFETLANTGIRVSEFIKLELDDVIITERNGQNNFSKVIIRQGKGEKYREIPLNNTARKAITEYLDVRTKTNSYKLFIGQRGELTRDAINKLLKRYSKAAAIEWIVTPHILRHTFATRLIRKGVPLLVVAELLGHSDPKTTADFYINISAQDKQNAVYDLDY